MGSERTVATLARGGELIKEVACSSADPECNFPDYPGTVGWKVGFLALRNAPVGDDGQELNPDLTDPNDPIGIGQRTARASAPIRSRAAAVFSLRPQRPHEGTASPVAPGGSTGYLDYLWRSGRQADNPQFHVPSGSRGLADLPGRNMLLTLGLWDEFVGRPFARAGAAFHELGHNMYLWHSGIPVAFRQR